MQKTIITAILLLSIISCTQTIYFEKDFYEKVSGIKLPHEYTLITTVDNGEFVTATILDFNHTDCQKFCKDNNFEPIPSTDSITLMGIYFIDSAYRKLPNQNQLLLNWGSKGSNNWTYLLDTTNCRLYCEIFYPD